MSETWIKIVTLQIISPHSEIQWYMYSEWGRFSARNIWGQLYLDLKTLYLDLVHVVNLMQWHISYTFRLTIRDASEHIKLWY